MLQHIVTDTDIILYWDYSDKRTKHDTYFVQCNGTPVGRTDKTNFTLRGITAPTVTVSISLDEAGKELFFSETFRMKQAPRRIDVTKAPYFAVGDGVTKNTQALQRAIDDCGEGECVYLPEGIFLSGALRLHSDMELYVSEGAELRGSEQPEDYLPRIWSRFEGKEMECYSSLLNFGDIADRDKIVCRNVLIRGGGKIFGGGKALAQNVIDSERTRLEADPNFKYDDTCSNRNTIPGRVRPKLFNISCSENIVIDNLDVGQSSCWNLHMIYSKHIITCNTRFHSCDVWNGDGWDPDSSEDCTLFHCEFYTSDDCVAIKSGKNPEGNVIAKPCKNIRIFDCHAHYGHSFAIGSEMSGGVEDVRIWDCDLSKTIYGLEIKATPKRGGYVKNISMHNCRLPRIMIHAVGYNDDGIAAPTVPYFGDCIFEDVTATGKCFIHLSQEIQSCKAIELCGFDGDHMIENVVFRNLTLEGDAGSVEQTISLQNLRGVSFTGLTVQ